MCIFVVRVGFTQTVVSAYALNESSVSNITIDNSLGDNGTK